MSEPLEQPDLLDEARLILSGESMLLATNAHLSAVVQHFVGLLKQTYELDELALEALRDDRLTTCEECLMSNIDGLKAWERNPLPDDAEKRQALKGA